MPEKQPITKLGGATGAAQGDDRAWSESVQMGLMSPMPPTNLATAMRVASSLKIECSIRRSVPARARIDSTISSVSWASGMTAVVVSLIGGPLR